MAHHYGTERLQVSYLRASGFIYIYISNEDQQDMDVYFDDLKVNPTLGNVVAGSDFYPFGLTMEERDITREEFRYGYQGNFAEEDEETEWNSFELRMYDPVIGRWMATDPAGQYASPYVGMGNNAINGIDPDGAYSKFGAWWRSLFHPGSKVVPIGDEYGVMFSSWVPDGNGGYLQRMNTFYEGNIVFDFDPEHFKGQGFEVGGNFKITMGMQLLNDNIFAGYTLNAGSVTLLEWSPKLAWEYGKGFSQSTLGLHYAGQNGIVKFSQGASYEGGGDLKYSVDYIYNQKTAFMTKVNTHVGIGAPFVEAKYSHDNVHGGGVLKVGLQEDASRSLNTGTGLSFGVSGSLNAQMTYRLNN
ncbi:RHS repeat domain-containing protein [Fulvivirga sediminis]|uniref:RHS repeat-associated core domain-containing protein n=1 Tax=Fulvivirga sediminis TaxID=2803949 RepID=A0A937F6H0_9BACT|nr:RHS repeat-associated core domain-containing protein [Fulvivirga sediminis]MBL3655897.1 hypothetical protein [Fulvivirga sediminis]